MKNFSHPILQRTFADLNFSPKFLEFAAEEQFPTPADMLQLSVFQLETRGMDEDLIFEFVRFLEKAGLGDLLTEK
ncbi:hypothetical protein [Pedobacter faecalis]|uniref:hypothetical protein n=1 Tax=Pedobacter faecalis TaxID=3041495 RepID=UPI00254A52A7|nr:hypothetical protein [Pedobacter sp. ELA7]